MKLEEDRTDNRKEERKEWIILQEGKMEVR